MNVNGPWHEAAEGSALGKASESVDIQRLQALIGEKLKGLESYKIDPETIQAAVDKTLEAVCESRPEIKILGSRQEGNLIIVDVKVPLHMAHLLRR